MPDHEAHGHRDYRGRSPFLLRWTGAKNSAVKVRLEEILRIKLVFKLKEALNALLRKEAIPPRLREREILGEIEPATGIHGHGIHLGAQVPKPLPVPGSNLEIQSKRPPIH